MGNPINSMNVFMTDINLLNIWKNIRHRSYDGQ